MRTRAPSVLLLAALGAAPAAAADDDLTLAPLDFHSLPLPEYIQPADAAAGQPAAEPNKRLRSWELPAITVEGQAPSNLHEEERVGPYGQPRWTATRRFPTTRVYVIPEGKVEVEGWARGTFLRDKEGGGTEWRFLQEVEIGLPYRFQVDIYARQDYQTDPDDTLWGGQFEVRWALADWGKLPGNPTLYFEYLTLESRPDRIEPKLLFGGEIAEGWHWGVNFVGEFELSGEREAEYEMDAGISYSLIDSVLAIGVENKYSMSDAHGDRGHFTTEDYVGPSIQWKPIPNLTINISPLIGVTGESAAAQVTFNVGWEF